MRSLLEQKIRSFLANVAPQMDIDDFELILLSEFDYEGQLKIVDTSKQREIYMKYWEKFNDTET